MFPAMTGYLTRSRDATRISHLSIVATAVQSYYIDKNTYPDTPSSGCLPKEALKEYLPNIPLDPTPERLSS